MNRKNIYSLFLIMFFMLATVGFVVADSSYFDFTASVEFPKFREASVEHVGVNTVSKELSVLNLKSSVNFGDYISAKAEMLYYFDDKSSQIETLEYGKILHKSPFYMEVSGLSDNDSISYQIKVTLKKQDSDEDFYAYWPSSTTFNKTKVVDSKSTDVVATEGGIVEFESGNQEYKNTKVVIPGGALSGDTTIIIKQLPLSLVGMSSAYMASSNTLKNQIIALYSITTDPIVQILNPILVDFYYGDETEVKKFDLKYRADDASDWENVKIEKTDNVNRIISAYITKFGQYGIFVSSNLNDNDYRPKKRVKVKSKIQSGSYEGFEFNYLQEGDVVKIYNVNGKKVAELKSITNGVAYWNGRKDTDNSGDWAESGTYIYQIKLKEKGKVVSGTIAFVW